MNNVEVKIINKSSNSLPAYSHKGDAAMDIRADFTFKPFKEEFAYGAIWDDTSKCVNLFSGGRCLIGTGIFVQLPSGHKLDVRPRSGLAIKNGITICNSPGLLDENYTGELGIELINLSGEVFQIFQGDRIAQIVVTPIPKIEWKEVTSLEETERGDNGFNSTGVK